MTAEATAEAPAAEPTKIDGTEETLETPDGEQPDESQTPDLGDAGKKAIQAEREARKVAEKAAREANERIAALEAKAAGREAEHAAEVEASKARDEVLAKANGRIVSAELRAAASGKLADPMDALAFIDPTDFEVSDDGAVDADAITAAIADLIERKPHLAARGGNTATGPQPDRSQGATTAGVGSTTAQQFAAAISPRK